MVRTVLRRRKHPPLHDVLATTVDHPKSVPVLDADDADDISIATDLGDNLRYRLVSETAFRHLAERGYAEGYEGDDWLEAETEVDGVVPKPANDNR